MREIGTLKLKKSAENFVYFMRSQGIKAEAKAEENGNWSIWIHAEKDIELGKQKFKEFILDPENDFFKKEAKKGIQSFKKEKLLEKKLEALESKVRQNVLSSRSIGNSLGSVTLSLIAISVFLFLFKYLKGLSHDPFFLYYSEYSSLAFHEIRNGQVWRLFTPMFLHGNWLHLIFNMLWLYELGNMIENNKRSIYFLTLVMVISSICNTTQYIITGPNFLGMSGVIYGLLGYIWMEMKFGSTSHYYLNSFTIGFLLFWFFFCLTGLIGNVANTNHGVGLCIGMLWSFSSNGRTILNSIKRLQMKDIAFFIAPFLFAIMGVLADYVKNMIIINR